MQWRNCLARLRGDTDPIFGRMIVMPLENTITCGDSMEGRDGEDEIFCKEAMSSVKILHSTPFGGLQWRNCLARLRGDTDPIFGRKQAVSLGTGFVVRYENVWSLLVYPFFGKVGTRVTS